MHARVRESQFWRNFWVSGSGAASVSICSELDEFR
jgi:hypothetical protein